MRFPVVALLLEFAGCLLDEDFVSSREVLAFLFWEELACVASGFCFYLVTYSTCRVYFSSALALGLLTPELPWLLLSDGF